MNTNTKPKFTQGITPGILNSQNIPLLGSQVEQVQPEPFLKPPESGMILTNPKRPTSQIRDAIAYNETRGVSNPYSFSQPSGSSTIGNALGKYQVTSARLKEKGKQFLGRDIQEKEFLSNPKLQDKFVDAQNAWLRSQGLTDEQILATHRGGWGDLSPQYLSKVTKERADYINNARAFLK